MPEQTRQERVLTQVEAVCDRHRQIFELAGVLCKEIDALEAKADKAINPEKEDAIVPEPPPATAPTTAKVAMQVRIAGRIFLCMHREGERCFDPEDSYWHSRTDTTPVSDRVEIELESATCKPLTWNGERVYVGIPVGLEMIEEKLTLASERLAGLTGVSHIRHSIQAVLEQIDTMLSPDEDEQKE